jgi:hypothetical protein
MVMAQRARQWLWNGARNQSIPALKGGVGSKKIVFLYVRSHQLIENTGNRAQNEPKTNLKQSRNEAKLEAKKAKQRNLRKTKRRTAIEGGGF